MPRKPRGVLVTLAGRPFVCLACGEKVFLNKEMTVNTQFMGTSATGLVCMDCGFLHTFLDGGKVDMFRPDFGYPS